MKQIRESKKYKDRSGKANRRGGLNTVDLLIKAYWYVPKLNDVFI
jgi:hypothetical protein